MTDRERALAYLTSIEGHLNPDEHAAAWFAAARREGAAEMQERAATAAIEAIDKVMALADLAMRSTVANAAARAIRALQLTPEAPV